MPQTIFLTEKHSVTVPDGAALNPEPTTDPRPVYTIGNPAISVAEQMAAPFNGLYFTEPGANIQLTGELRDSNDQLVNMSIPVSLKMPFVRYAEGRPTDDEVYLSVTLQNGILTSTGQIPRSGDWRVINERNNQALDAISAEFQLSAPDVVFLA